jgi:hypothetical protein
MYSTGFNLKWPLNFAHKMYLCVSCVYQNKHKKMAAAIYRQQKVLSNFPVCCWIDWLLMIKNCLIESGPPFIYIYMYTPIFS